MTRDTPLHYRSIAEITTDMAAGSISAEEVTRQTLERIASLEPMLHAFAEVRADAALDEARAADASRAAGEPPGPLHGVPIAVKDLCAMPGTDTRAGGFFPTGFAPGDLATVVARLQAAGAIIVGKSQLTEGAWGAHHPDIIPPVNPWSPDHWTGVSSSGSGVSVAAGLAYGAIGTDTAGSIRFPSACCHLVGLKPTWGRVSRHGVFPLADTFDHVGPMARSVLDTALMFSAIAGPDERDPTALDEPGADWAGAARGGTLEGVRIGIDPGYALAGVDPATADALKGAIAVMKSAGAEVVEVSMPDPAGILEAAILAAFTEAAISHAATYPAQSATYSAAYASILDLGRSASAPEYARIAIWRRAFRGRLTQLFHEVDMLVAPVLPVSPPEVGDMAAATSAPPLASAPLLGFTIPFNLAGVPCLTLPMGKAASGAPLGFQLIGPDLSEATLLAAGAGYEAASGFADQHPAL
jgi:amidase